MRRLTEADQQTALRRAQWFLDKASNRPPSWNEGLMCFLRLAVSVCPGVVGLYLREGGCTDMCGAIRLATDIDSGVQMTITVSGYDLDTVYILSTDGDCDALAHPTAEAHNGESHVLN